MAQSTAKTENTGKARGFFTRLPVSHASMHLGLQYCRFSDAVVILDVVPDRYRLLQGEAVHRFTRMVAGQGSPEDIAWLAARGIEGAARNPLAEFVPPYDSAVGPRKNCASVFLTFKAAWHQLEYQRRLKSKPLHELLQNLINHRPCVQANDDIALDITSAFQRSKHYISAQDKCLPRALAMMHMLLHAGIKAQLIFGVTMPFAAHCWVQHGGLVLSDPLDRVRPFQPIMIL